MSVSPLTANSGSPTGIIWGDSPKANSDQKKAAMTANSVAATSKTLATEITLTRLRQSQNHVAVALAGTTHCA